MARVKQQLTARGLAALKPGEWANDARPHGSGQLQARKLSTGDVAFYYRYTAPGRRQDRLPLGTDLTLSAAREKAAELSRRYQAGDRDLRAVIEAERALAETKATEERATLGALLEAYVEALSEAGKVTAPKVGLSIDLHVRKAWPTLWAVPAGDLALEDLLPVISRVVRQGKLREAEKLRAYLRAAYAAAIRARQDPAAPDALRALQITSNPVRDMVPVQSGSNTRSRALTLAEIRRLWQRAAAMQTPAGAALRFYLLTGGQRVAQLGRVTVDDLDGEQMRILDMKGRRRQPRQHLVPLIPAAQDAMAAMRDEGFGPFVFTLSQGVKPLSYSQFRGIVLDVSLAMEAAGELEGTLFTPGDLRRTIETRLAAAGQSREARAQLQSHGLGGVQSRHYDRHEYEAEKRMALEVLHRLLTQEPATVTPIGTVAVR